MPNVRPRASEVRIGSTAIRAPGRLVATVFAVARAAARIVWHQGVGLPELVTAIKAPGFTGVDPWLAPRITEKLLPLLPPYRLGRCMKRSFLLIELWSRSGLEPVLHLGFWADPSRQGHAWVTTRDPRFATTKPAGIVEAWTA